jgi:hypothetical protein
MSARGVPSLGGQGGGREAVAIRRAGELALAACTRGAEATVAAVFARSFYLDAGGTFLCVSEADIGNGPLTLIADGAARIADRDLYPGMAASMSARTICVGEAVEFRLDGCTLWRPPAWPAAPPAPRAAWACGVLAARAIIEAPAEGLAQVTWTSSGSDRDSTPLARAGGAGITALQVWFGGALARDGAEVAPAPVRRLIGLGPGLTPSGDDFLCGALAMLDALAECRVHAALADAIAVAVPALTSPLSACLLRAAAAGHIGARLHDLVAALITGDVEAAIGGARAIGHSSGWDMLAGAATAMRTVVAQRLPAATAPVDA